MVSIDADTGGDGTSLDLPDTGDSPERALLRSERARTLHDAIRELPDRLDEVVERNFFGDESLTDIARDLGVTLSRVSQMRARALTLLHAVHERGVAGAGRSPPTVGCAPGTSSGPTWTASPPAGTPPLDRRQSLRSPRSPHSEPTARHGWHTPNRFASTQRTARPA